MKLLFYIQRLEDAHLAHALALYFKEQLGATAFSALSFREQPEQAYLAQETQGLFSQLLSETQMYRAAETATLEPDFIASIESRYGLPFWLYVSQDRFLTMRRANYLFSYGTAHSRESLQKHIQMRFKMTERFLDEVKPDAVVYVGVDVGPSSALILERVAKARGIPVIVPLSSKIGAYHTLIDTVFSRAKNVEARFAALQAGLISHNAQKSKDVIASFREGNLVLPYIKDVKVGQYQKALKPAEMLRRLKSIARLRWQAGGVYHQKHQDIYNLSQLEYELFRLGIEYRNLRLKFGNYFSQPKEESFVFFPLHLEPELALLLYAPYQANQLAVVQNVAQSLPADVCLYVKEHPQSVAKKGLEFYRRIATMPNTRSIYPHTSSRSLIANARGIVTINSTVGMEAMLMGKPAVTLGDVFYTFVDKLVWRAKSHEDLPAMIRQFDAFKPDEKMLETFVTALLDESIEVDPEVLARDLSKLPLEQKAQHPDFEPYAHFLANHLMYLKADLSPLSLVAS
ncbi:MAG: hypothetical protein KC422_14145 [Trueperaceae bacterium]|nr:hypothetical protein [Trueperaceae bacterium]